MFYSVKYEAFFARISVATKVESYPDFFLPLRVRPCTPQVFLQGASTIWISRCELCKIPVDAYEFASSSVIEGSSFLCLTTSPSL